MTLVTRIIAVTFLSVVVVGTQLQAQEISGFSTVTIGRFSSGANAIPAVQGGPVLEVRPYMDTEEDYTASLYYNVTSSSALFAGGSQSSLAGATVTGNPKATATYIYQNPRAQLYTEVTNHIVNFFYVSSAGQYYDPYGYSTDGGDPDGDYNSGYWFSVYGYGAYIAEASTILGQTYEASNFDPADYQGPWVVSALFQAFIAPDYVAGPPAMNCPSNIYAGDDRGFNLQLGSYRGFQQITVGVGGDTSVNQVNAPPAQGTGFTYQFSPSVLQNNVIPPTAYNFDYLGKCGAAGVNAFGHATTAQMIAPTVTYNGLNSTSTTFKAAIANPVPLWSFSIDWDSPITLTEPTTTDLHVSGTLYADCYPSFEVSVGSHDVQTWTPSSNSLVYIVGCLGGGSPVNKPISYDIPLAFNGSH